MFFPQQGGELVPLPNGRRVVEPQLEAGWARATMACLNTASQGESLCLFPLFIPVTAAIRGWPASLGDSGSQWPTWLMDPLHAGLGAHRCQGSRKPSPDPERAKLKPCNKQRMVSQRLKRLGRGPGSKSLGWVEQGQTALGPESEQPSPHTWAEEMTDSCKGAE